MFLSPERYKVICAGRRWGKTLGATNWLILLGLKKPHSLLWWVSPVYQQAKIAFNYFRRYHPELIEDMNISELRIVMTGGSVVEYKSADHPDNLRGVGVDGLVMDECATVKEETWTEVLRATLMDKQAPACFIGTPKGANWFKDLYDKGIAGDKEIMSCRYASSTNPHLPSSEIEKARIELPDRVFKQEYLAEFVDDTGGVFRGVKNCISGQLEQPVDGHSYMMGVDLGKYQDFTVITVIDIDTKHVVAFDRFKDINWSLQEQRILSIANDYMPHILIDQGQVGDAILEALREKYDDIEGIKFTNENKTAMINYLSNLIEKKQITYPDLPILINELTLYEYEILEVSRKLRMNAPSGKHDDTVISLALAAWGMFNRAENVDWDSLGKIEVVKKDDN